MRGRNEKIGGKKVLSSFKIQQHHENKNVSGNPVFSYSAHIYASDHFSIGTMNTERKGDGCLAKHED